MKKFVGLVVILAALILGSYYGMGIATERTVKANLDRVNQSKGVFVNVTDYKRGWFTSTATLDWKFQVPEHVVKTANGQSQTVPAQEYQMPMALTIYHGPVIFANNTVKFGMGYAHTDLALPAQYNQQFGEHFSPDSTKPELDLSLFVSYLNNSTIETAIPAFKLIAKEGNGQFEWLGFNSNVSVSSNQDKIKGDALIDGIQFSKDTVKGVVGEITTEYDMHRVADNMYLGDFNLSFPSLVINDKDQKVFELDNLAMQTSSDIENGLFNSHFQMSLDTVFAHGKTYGPGSVEMALRNLDGDVLISINNQAQQLQGSEQQQQQAILALIPEIPKLFSKGAEFEISTLTFKMPQGTIEGNMLVSLPQGDNSNPFEMLQKIHGNGKLQIPAEVVKQVLDTTNQQRITAQQAQQAQQAPADGSSAATPDSAPQVSQMTSAQLAAMTQSGLIVQQGSDYVIELNLDQGKLSVNGQPFNPAMVKF
ncbi:YdgA family protein [Legionella dresdenensis]|uniref:YdgA family protein n=1 Tax=Legionella dresdenensis TaxID=450200 RepID=A0ABV8CFS1_9GAMM